MKEQIYLERQEVAAQEQICRALTGNEGEPPTEIIERVTRDHPLLAIGGAAALGGVAGALLGRASGAQLVGLARPVWRTLGRLL